MTEPTTPSGHQRHLPEKVTDEFSRLVIILGYVWVIFELLSLHKSIVLSEYHLNYPEHAFAIVNSLVLAKVLLTQSRLWDIILKLSRCVRTEPLHNPSHEGVTKACPSSLHPAGKARFRVRATCLNRIVIPAVTLFETQNN